MVQRQHALRGAKWPVKIKFLHGSVIKMLRRLPDNSVHAAVTSPPYWRLRDYGYKGQLGQEATHDCGGWASGKKCGKCYVCHMVAVFHELRRVLRDDGTLWLNLGDSYATDSAGKHGHRAAYTGILAKKTIAAQWDGSTRKQDAPVDKTPYRTMVAQEGSSSKKSGGLKSSDLIGIPWRVALALQADGWYLRSECIWSKNNPAPESVSSRPGRSHEQVFMLTKSRHYYYDHFGVRQESANGSDVSRSYAMIDNTPGAGGASGASSTRNLWTVWNLSNPGTSEQHVAAYPPKLIETAIMASTSARGCCPKCGTGWVRRLSRDEGHTEHPRKMVKDAGKAAEEQWAGTRPWTTVGWHPNCECFGHFLEKKASKVMASGKKQSYKKVLYIAGKYTPAPVPAIVIDPFVGSGTTLAVAKYMGRSGVGIDMSEKYLDIARPRLERIQAPWYVPIEPVP